MLIREMLAGDLDGVVGLQSACFPSPFPAELLWRHEHLVRHLEIFPEGQFVAVEEDRIVGSASALIVSEGVWQAHSDWDATTGGRFLSNHDPSGTTLYGVDISVHPHWQGQGIGRALYKARFELVRAEGLIRYGTTCRLPGWILWSIENPGRTQSDYAAAVERGAATDRTLTPLLRYGLILAGIAENHIDDEESGDAAAILEWKP